MKDTIYIPIILFRPVYEDCYFELLRDKIKSFHTPDGLKIISVERFNEPLTQQILNLVNTLNTSPDYKDDRVIEGPEHMIRIHVEANSNFRFSKMLWFEEQIIMAIDEICRTAALYYFYLIDSGKAFRSCNIAKIKTDDGYDFMIDNEEDDMSVLQEAAPFLAHYWYMNNEVHVSEVYPAETAKYLLVFEL